jgi:hypothetical protein
MPIGRMVESWAVNLSLETPTTLPALLVAESRMTRRIKRQRRVINCELSFFPVMPAELAADAHLSPLFIAAATRKNKVPEVIRPAITDATDVVKRHLFLVVGSGWPLHPVPAPMATPPVALDERHSDLTTARA